MTRYFSGDCGPCKVLHNENHYLKACPLCGRHGRPPPLAVVDRVDFSVALSVLERFDFIVILELLSDPAHMGRLRQTLHLPEVFHFRHARAVPAAHDPANGIPLPIRRRLEEENAPDLELYREFKSRALTGCRDTQGTAAAAAAAE